MDPATVMAIGWGLRWLGDKMRGKPKKCAVPGCVSDAVNATNCCATPLCDHHGNVYNTELSANGRCPIRGCGQRLS